MNTESEGYKSLARAVEQSESDWPRGDAYRVKFAWVIERSHHYAEKTGIGADEILDAWEKRRNYWFLNYYQDVNQPRIDSPRVRVFDTLDALKVAIELPAYRCPACNGISTSPSVCDTGLPMRGGKVCDWTVGGLLGDLGEGVFVFVKSEVRGQTIFMPVAWEVAMAEREAV